MRIGDVLKAKPRHDVVTIPPDAGRRGSGSVHDLRARRERNLPVDGERPRE